MSKLWLYGAGSGALALLLGACTHPAASPTQTPTVGVVTVAPRTVPLTKSLVGRLSAYRSANVLARVAGVLLARDYDEGSEVRAGQVLFRIDPAPFEAALNGAKAQLAQAKATAADDAFNAQQAIALAPQGYVSKTDLQSALAADRTAKAAVLAAAANVQAAEINLGYTTVLSPIAGRAGEQQATEGALVGQGTPTLLTTVDQLDPLFVNFTVSVAELDELRAAVQTGGVTLKRPDAATVAVSLPDGTPYPGVGTVDFSSPTVDPATGSVDLRAVLPNPQFTLLPGAYVTLRLDLGERHGVYLVPQAAVQRDITGPYVLTVGADRKVVRDAVVTDGTRGLDWLVTSGLAPGERVIVSGVSVAAVGSIVRTRSWAPRPSALRAPVGRATRSNPIAAK